ncbi:major facilitator superfamily transporter [Fusarium coicis]|nr:major facilitator superfamily transporter [Fusarium coicis]
MPPLYIGIITVLWGILMTLHGIVKDFGVIVTVRFIMGIFKAGFFPGAIAVLNKWYTKRPSWLTDEECDYLIRRMVAQNGGERADEEGQKLTLALIKDVVTDWQYYPLILCYWSSTVPIYGMKFTLPQIIKNMGYSIE